MAKQVEEIADDDCAQSRGGVQARQQLACALTPPRAPWSDGSVDVKLYQEKT